MSYASGFGAGLGAAVGENAKNMLEAELSRYKSLAKVYEGIASNPDAFPEVQKEAMRRIGLLTQVDPRNPKSKQSVRGFENTKDIWDANDALRSGQTQTMPSLDFKAAASGHPGPVPLGGGAPQNNSGAVPLGGGAMPQPSSAVPLGGKRPDMFQMPGSVQQSVGVQPGGQNAPAIDQNHPLAGPVLGKLEEMGIPRDKAMSILEEVNQEAGPAPPTQGMMTPEYKLWLKAKGDILSAKLKAHSQSAEEGQKYKELETAINAAYPAGKDEATDKMRQQLLLAALFGTKNVAGMLNPAQVRGGVTYIGTDGQVHTSPGSMIGGTPFVPTADGGSEFQQPVAFSRPTLTTDAQGNRVWVYPGGPPQDTGVDMPLIGSVTQTTENPVTLQRFSQTDKVLPGGSGGAPTTSTPTPAPVAPPTNGPVMASDIVRANMGTEDAPKTSAAIKKRALDPVAYRKTTASWQGVAHIVDISDVMKSNPVVGPVLGRTMQLMNQIGSSKLAEIAQRLMTASSQQNLPAYRAALAEEERELTNLSNKALSEMVQKGEFGLTQETASKVGHDVAKVITLMRSLNGLELIAMSGSGNGITRLYEMMSPALMNPNQDPSMVAGHAAGLSDMFVNIIGKNASDLEQSWDKLEPWKRELLGRVGMEEKYRWYTGGGTSDKSDSGNVGVPDGTFPSGPHKGKTRYKYPGGFYSPNPTEAPQSGASPPKT